MKKHALFNVSLLLAPLLACKLYAQVDIAGTWEAELGFNESNETRQVALEFRFQDDDLTGTIIVGNNPRLPLEDLRVQGDVVMFELSTETDERVQIRFIGKVQGEGIFFHGMQVFLPVQPDDYPFTRLAPVIREIDFTAARVR